MNNLPTEEQCLQYFDQYKVPQNIKDHCLNVQKIAVFIAKKLKEKGININLDLVSSAALLHDLFKMVTIVSIGTNKFHQQVFSEEELIMRKELMEKYPDMHEGEVSYLVFKDNYPELAVALRDMSNPEKESKSWEELIAHYADGRIFQNKVVDLQERFSYLVKAYPEKTDVFKKNYQELSNFENRMKEITGLQPDQLAEEISDG